MLLNCDRECRAGRAEAAPPRRRRPRGRGTQTAEDDGGASRGDRRGDGGAAMAANAPPAVVTLEQWAEQEEQHHAELRDFTWSTGFGTSCDDAETRRCFKIKSTRWPARPNATTPLRRWWPGT